MDVLFTRCGGMLKACSVQSCLLLFVLVTSGLLLALSRAGASVRDGRVALIKDALTPGVKLDLTGKWLYKPGYAFAKDEHPEDPAGPEQGYVLVPVPQIRS